MISVRRADQADAAAIAAVHVSAWRSAYPGILPENYLAGLSPTRQAMFYKSSIARGGIVQVATSQAAGPRIVGFTTAGAPRTAGLGDGEIETLYVLDDWRDQGVGRDLIRAAAFQLAARGCRSVFVWVLRDNPSRFFYEHLRGQPAAQGETRVAGISLPQLAYAWDPIDRLLVTQ